MGPIVLEIAWKSNTPSVAAGVQGGGGGSGVIDGTNLESGPLRRNVDVTK